MITRIRRLSRIWKIIGIGAGAASVLALAAVPVAAASHAPATRPGSTVTTYTVTGNSHETTVRFHGAHPGATVILFGHRVKIRDGVARAVRLLASPDVPGYSYKCDLKAYGPEWTYTRHIINSKGSQDCTGTGWAYQRVRVAVESHIGLFIWHIDARDGSPFTNDAFTSWITDYDCDGTGTHTYRTVVDGYTRDGDNVVTDTSGSFQMVCTS